MTIYEFFEHNKDYKPWVTIKDYLSGKYLYEGFVISISDEIATKPMYRWSSYNNEHYVINVKE